MVPACTDVSFRYYGLHGLQTGTGPTDPGIIRERYVRRPEPRGRRVVKRAALALVLVLAVPPALADQPIRTPEQKRALIGKCIAEYGAEHSERCVEIIDPEAAGRRAYRDYYRRDLGDELARERHCWNDPRIINPRGCAEGLPPVFSRKP